MAIGFVRSRYVSRSSGGNACRSSAYNARSKIMDERTGEVFDFSDRSGNVYHEVLMPEHVDKKFKDISVLANEVEKVEKRKDSQIYIEWVLALPKEEEVTLEMKKELVYKFIEYKGWIRERIGVQIDIHEPDQDETNWHAHLLVTTRRFNKDGIEFERLKARDLQPKVVNKKVIEETKDSIAWTNMQNKHYRDYGLIIRVDLPYEITQEHVGPVRMRSVFNRAAERNEERRIANIKYLNSGKRVLEHVSKHMSVFNRGDLERALKIIDDKERREQLVEKALSSKSLVTLYDDTGKETGYFTTKHVRNEEKKLLRLSDYISQAGNNLERANRKANSIVKDLLREQTSDLNDEQKASLKHLLIGNSGIRILKRRAGTGKSRVLGRLCSIYKAAGVNIIGIAPTHKARMELAGKGFARTDTIKGMLFKLYNYRFDLPNNSAVVVDEAGMIGNDDFSELLRVCASRKCNLILAGDERQLTSVQRGGMFEVFAENYGYSLLSDIQRQEKAWARNVAMAFSNGEVSSGVKILEDQGAIKVAANKADSMQELLKDWNEDGEVLENKLIIAVKNKDVEALNAGAREYLKLAGRLTGEEISVGGRHYMKGDRIIITETNKKLGLNNGDFAEILEVSKERFIIKAGASKPGRVSKGVNDNLLELAFDPRKYNGFSHGYATTIFKAQGASINEVYILHDGFAGIRNSYVALSRCINGMRMYVNQQATRGINQLIKQLSYDPEKSSSISYFSKRDLEKRKINEDFDAVKGAVSGFIVGALEYAGRKIVEFGDKRFYASSYYNYTPEAVRQEKVEEVLGREELEEIVQFEGKKAVGENMRGSWFSPSLKQVLGKGIKQSKENKEISDGTSVGYMRQVSGTKLSAKERFYKQVDNLERRREVEAAKEARKELWNMEAEKLRHEVRFRAEDIARELLGEPNTKLSNGRTLRWGEHGKVALHISGEKAGRWYDFSVGKGGNIFTLVQEKRGCDFKEAAEYLRQKVGMEPSSSIDMSVRKNNIKLVYDANAEEKYKEYLNKIEKEIEERENKQKQVDRLFGRSKEIGDKSIAYNYLKQIRGINCELSQDIRTAGIFQKMEGEKTGGKYYPGLIAFARNKEGKVTGGQQILLDKKTYGKANIDVPKRSFGIIGSSFVDVGNTKVVVGKKEENTKNLTIIAEGIETALSVKQALSLDDRNNEVNIKVLCSLGIGNIRNYKAEEGEEKIQKAFRGAVIRQSTKNLKEYFANQTEGARELTNQEKADIEFLQKYKVDEEKIVETYRKSNLDGMVALDSARKGLWNAQERYNENREILEEAGKYGFNTSERDVVKELVEFGTGISEAKEHCKSVRDKQLEKHINNQLAEFQQAKNKAKTPEEALQAITKEQNYLMSLEKAKTKVHDPKILKEIEAANETSKKNMLTHLKESVVANQKQGLKSEEELTKLLISPSSDIYELKLKIDTISAKNREEVLRWVQVYLGYLKKLNVEVDKDKLVGKIKSMSLSEKDTYMKSVIAEEAGKYVKPLLDVYKAEKEKASNLNEMFDAIKNEHNTYLNLYNDHRMAVFEYDKSRGSKEISVAAFEAHNFEMVGGMRAFKKAIDFAEKYKIKTEKQIFDSLKEDNGNNRSTKYSLTQIQKECQNYHRIEIDRELMRQSNPLQYLTTIKEKHDRGLIPMEYINTRIKQHEQHNTHEQLNKALQRNLNKDMDGPNL